MTSDSVKEVLWIRNFMGIEKLSIEIKRFNIVIGPQASGKSLVAKLIYFMNRAETEIAQGAMQAKLKKEIDSDLSYLFNQVFPIGAWGRGDFELGYQRGSFEITICKKASKDEIKLQYGDAALKLLDVVRKKSKKVRREQVEQESFVARLPNRELRDFAQNKQEELYGAPPLANPIFIPAGRSFYSAIKEGFWSLITKSMTVDPIYSDFGSIYENMKGFWASAPNSKLKKGSLNFDREIEKLLRGRPIREKGQDFILASDQRRIRMMNASSGQQELYPLLVVLKTLTSAIHFPTLLLIEEPEAHLFPKTQSDLMWLISKSLSRMPAQSKVFITTHSPYVLATLNNQILASQIPKSKRTKKLSQYTDASLPSECVAASFIDSGRLAPISRGEYGLLDAALIDSVSSEISELTDDLLSEVILG